MTDNDGVREIGGRFDVSSRDPQVLQLLELIAHAVAEAIVHEGRKSEASSGSSEPVAVEAGGIIGSRRRSSVGLRVRRRKDV